MCWEGGHALAGEWWADGSHLTSAADPGSWVLPTSGLFHGQVFHFEDRMGAPRTGVRPPRDPVVDPPPGSV